ncbi:MAG: hypothetical protein LQ351_005999 [Letrouitia transgressa]|nr:MAG: hypothetical protein LQ351_005999 [Letrouitia transgressa]
MSKQPQYYSISPKGGKLKENEPRVGWTDVDHRKKPNNRKSELGGAYNRAQLTSPAARSRQSVYSGGSKPYFKESCLPTDERDPVLLEIEKSKGQRMSKECFRAGMIIRAPLHEQDYIAACGESNLTVDADRYRTSTPLGSIYSKQRHMIILRLFEDHYTAIPLFTHNGNGLVNKRNPNEFVSVRDHRLKEPFRPLSVHEPLTTEYVKDGILPFDVKTTAHVTYPLSRKYELPIIHEGNLRAGSLNNLVRIFNELAPRQKK